jgi:hypothetical protein
MQDVPNGPMGIYYIIYIYYTCNCNCNNQFSDITDITIIFFNHQKHIWANRSPIGRNIFGPFGVQLDIPGWSWMAVVLTNDMARLDAFLI